MFLSRLFRPKDEREKALRAAEKKLAVYEQTLLRELKRWESIPAQRQASLARIRHSQTKKLMLLYSWALVDLLDTFHKQAVLLCKREWLRILIDAAAVGVLVEKLEATRAWRRQLFDMAEERVGETKSATSAELRAMASNSSPSEPPLVPMDADAFMLTPTDLIKASPSIKRLQRRIARINEKLTEIDLHVQTLKSLFRGVPKADRRVLLLGLLSTQSAAEVSEVAAEADVAELVGSLKNELAMMAAAARQARPVFAFPSSASSSLRLHELEGGSSSSSCSSRNHSGGIVATQQQLARSPHHEVTVGVATAQAAAAAAHRQHQRLRQVSLLSALSLSVAGDGGHGVILSARRPGSSAASGGWGSADSRSSAGSARSGVMFRASVSSRALTTNQQQQLLLLQEEEDAEEAESDAVEAEVSPAFLPHTLPLTHPAAKWLHMLILVRGAEVLEGAPRRRLDGTLRVVTTGNSNNPFVSPEATAAAVSPPHAPTPSHAHPPQQQRSGDTSAAATHFPQLLHSNGHNQQHGYDHHHQQQWPSTEGRSSSGSWGVRVRSSSGGGGGAPPFFPAESGTENYAQGTTHPPGIVEPLYHSDASALTTAAAGRPPPAPSMSAVIAHHHHPVEEIHRVDVMAPKSAQKGIRGSHAYTGALASSSNSSSARDDPASSAGQSSSGSSSIVGGNISNIGGGVARTLRAFTGAGVAAASTILPHALVAREREAAEKRAQAALTDAQASVYSALDSSSSSSPSSATATAGAFGGNSGATGGGIAAAAGGNSNASGATTAQLQQYPSNGTAPFSSTFIVYPAESASISAAPTVANKAALTGVLSPSTTYMRDEEGSSGTATFGLRETPQSSSSASLSTAWVPPTLTSHHDPSTTTPTSTSPAIPDTALPLAALYILYVYGIAVPGEIAAAALAADADPDAVLAAQLGLEEAIASSAGGNSTALASTGTGNRAGRSHASAPHSSGTMHASAASAPHSSSGSASSSRRSSSMPHAHIVREAEDALSAALLGLPLSLFRIMQRLHETLWARQRLRTSALAHTRDAFRILADQRTLEGRLLQRWCQRVLAGGVSKDGTEYAYDMGRFLAFDVGPSFLFHTAESMGIVKRPVLADDGQFQTPITELLGSSNGGGTPRTPSALSAASSSLGGYLSGNSGEEGGANFNLSGSALFSSGSLAMLRQYTHGGTGGVSGTAAVSSVTPMTGTGNALGAGSAASAATTAATPQTTAAAAKGNKWSVPTPRTISAFLRYYTAAVAAEYDLLSVAASDEGSSSATRSGSATGSGSITASSRATGVSSNTPIAPSSPMRSLRTRPTGDDMGDNSSAKRGGAAAAAAAATASSGGGAGGDASGSIAAGAEALRLLRHYVDRIALPRLHALIFRGVDLVTPSMLSGVEAVIPSLSPADQLQLASLDVSAAAEPSSGSAVAVRGGGGSSENRRFTTDTPTSAAVVAAGGADSQSSSSSSSSVLLPGDSRLSMLSAPAVIHIPSQVTHLLQQLGARLVRSRGVGGIEDGAGGGGSGDFYYFAGSGIGGGGGGGRSSGEVATSTSGGYDGAALAVLEAASATRGAHDDDFIKPDAADAVAAALQSAFAPLPPLLPPITPYLPPITLITPRARSMSGIVEAAVNAAAAAATAGGETTSVAAASQSAAVSAVSSHTTAAATTRTHFTAGTTGPAGQFRTPLASSVTAAAASATPSASTASFSDAATTGTAHSDLAVGGDMAALGPTRARADSGSVLVGKLVHRGTAGLRAAMQHLHTTTTSTSDAEPSTPTSTSVQFGPVAIPLRPGHPASTSGRALGSPTPPVTVVVTSSSSVPLEELMQGIYEATKRLTDTHSDNGGATQVEPAATTALRSARSPASLASSSSSFQLHKLEDIPLNIVTVMASPSVPAATSSSSHFTAAAALSKGAAPVMHSSHPSAFGISSADAAAAAAAAAMQSLEFAPVPAAAVSSSHAHSHTPSPLGPKLKLHREEEEGRGRAYSRNAAAALPAPITAPGPRSSSFSSATSAAGAGARVGQSSPGRGPPTAPSSTTAEAGSAGGSAPSSSSVRPSGSAADLMFRRDLIWTRKHGIVARMSASEIGVPDAFLTSLPSDLLMVPIRSRAATAAATAASAGARDTSSAMRGSVHGGGEGDASSLPLTLVRYSYPPFWVASQLLACIDDLAVPSEMLAFLHAAIECTLEEASARGAAATAAAAKTAAAAAAATATSTASSSPQQQQQQPLVAADDLLPLLNYVCSRSSWRRPHACLSFLANYGVDLSASAGGRDAYMITLVQSCVAWICTRSSGLSSSGATPGRGGGGGGVSALKKLKKTRGASSSDDDDEAASRRRRAAASTGARSGTIISSSSSTGTGAAGAGSGGGHTSASPSLLRTVAEGDCSDSHTPTSNSNRSKQQRGAGNGTDASPHSRSTFATSTAVAGATQVMGATSTSAMGSGRASAAEDNDDSELNVTFSDEESSQSGDDDAAADEDEEEATSTSAVGLDPGGGTKLQLADARVMSIDAGLQKLRLASSSSSSSLSREQGDAAAAATRLLHSPPGLQPHPHGAGIGHDEQQDAHAHSGSISREEGGAPHASARSVLLHPPSAALQRAVSEAVSVEGGGDTEVEVSVDGDDEDARAYADLLAEEDSFAADDMNNLRLFLDANDVVERTLQIFG